MLQVLKKISIVQTSDFGSLPDWKHAENQFLPGADEERPVIQFKIAWPINIDRHLKQIRQR